MTSDITFAEVLPSLKNGEKAAREAWDKGEFIFLVPGSKFLVSRQPLLSIFEDGTPIEYRPHVDKRSADGTIGMWSPGIVDILSEDWIILD